MKAKSQKSKQKIKGSKTQEKGVSAHEGGAMRETQCSDAFGSWGGTDWHVGDSVRAVCQQKPGCHWPRSEGERAPTRAARREARLWDNRSLPETLWSALTVPGLVRSA